MGYEKRGVILSVSSSKSASVHVTAAAFPKVIFLHYTTTVYSIEFALSYFCHIEI